MKLKIFSGSAHPDLAENIARRIESPLLEDVLGEATCMRFPDGEISIKVQTDVRGSDVFIVQPTCPPVNDHLMELFILIDCLRRASAHRITAVIPYFGYARQDRKTEGRVPISAKLIANLITKAGVDRILTLDLHAGQIQGFFDIPVDHLYARKVLVKYFRSLGLEDIVVVSPDVGGIRMARAYASRLKAEFATVDKRRSGGSKVEAFNVIGNVEGKNVILIDDMIATGGSVAAAVELMKEKGAKKIYLGATHGIFCGNALERLSALPIEEVVVTNSVPPRDSYPPNFRVLSVAPLFADAILRIHKNRSVSALFHDDVEQE
ncbi:MAG: ribose-phosphate pyrophosphokinase [Planctomycetota bacterium]|nr:MAG: ribose-phosphate pyrophosphokinase [Planctomycetota bacterium]